MGSWGGGISPASDAAGSGSQGRVGFTPLLRSDTGGVWLGVSVVWPLTSGKVLGYAYSRL